MGYSDLEVRHSHERVNLMKEVVPQQNPPFPTQSEHQPIQMESEYPSLPTQNEYHRATLRICGLLPRTLWIVVGLVGLLLIGAIVGGVVGGLEAKKSKSSGIASNSSGNSGNGTSSNGSLAILLDSKLSAVNWTISGGTERQAVFYQDGWNSLLVSFRNTQNATWTSVNISQKLASTGNPIKVKSGTPLAGTAVGSPFSFSVSLFYFNSSNSVSEVSSVDETLETWTIGDLSKQGNLQPSDSSQLAAIAHFCEYGCAQLTYVVYEDDSQNIWLANSSDWRANSTGSLLSHVDPSSGLTLIPFAADNGDNITNAYELRLYYDASSQIEEYKFDIEMSWSSGKLLLDWNPYGWQEKTRLKAVNRPATCIWHVDNTQLSTACRFLFRRWLKR